ncbi:glycosyltransferase family 4 protein [Bacillus sp. FJAT-45066]|uniref:glycosyltransferase family 4 protein n=1 Tax=Bacillus sp. FJAT-45066 TaxID=2011010 RepID=UPI000BB74BFB|nr:glycosyltransferase family 1 protein [Bacillus sp. FJAT-45066]
MKIAIFTDTFAPDVNGVARTLKRFTDHLERNNIQYLVFAPESSNESIYNNHVHRFTSLPFFLYPECRLALPNVLHVKEELLTFKPDIIHVATPFNIGLCGLHYAKKLDIPVVGSYHTDFDKYLEYYDLQFLNPLLWKYMRWFHRTLSKIFVPSTVTREHLQKFGFTNLSIWSRGVDCTIFKPSFNKGSFKDKFNIKEKHVLLYVGRLAPEKDIFMLPKMANKLPKNIQENVHWLIVGDGPSKEELQNTAPSNMTFAGFLDGPQLVEAYANSDLLVFPSATETFGNVVLESLACGTPVIGANAGGVKTIIKNKETGILCEEKNIDDFSIAIKTILSDDLWRNEMSVNGRNYALSQSWDTIFHNLLEEYNKVLTSEKNAKILA